MQGDIRIIHQGFFQHLVYALDNVRPVNIPQAKQKDFVLGRFSKEEEAGLAPALERGLSALLAVLEKGLDEAMNLFNYDKPVS